MVAGLMNSGFVEDVYGTVDRIIRSSHPETPRAVVITPSTGSPFLSKAIQSVLTQDFENIFHLIVIDGIEFEDQVRQVVSRLDGTKCKAVVLPFNTGKNGINGHRIYAAFALLVNAEFIFYLDEDNWWDPDHAGSLIQIFETNHTIDWAYSMRKMYTHDEIYVADDNCESIGLHAPFSNVKKGWPSYVDTNCYAFRRNTIVQAAHYWYHPLRADRYVFYQLTREFPNYACSKKYTVNYRLKMNGPVSPEYVVEGNQYMVTKYGPQLPWL